MEVKTRDELLRDLVARSERYPTGWRAATRRDSEFLADEHYIFHPKAGVYEVKEYQVNPFKSSGVGARIASSVPSDFPSVLEEQRGTFGIVEIDMRRLLEELREAPEKALKPTELSQDVAIRVPLQGPSHGVASSLKSLDATLSRSRRVVDQEFRKLVDREGTFRAYA